MELLSVSAESNEIGKANEYENAIDRFVFWCDVEFEIDGKEYDAVAQFDCGYQADVGEWSSIDSDLLDVSDEQSNFISDCLSAAVKEMSVLKNSKK